MPLTTTIVLLCLICLVPPARPQLKREERKMTKEELFKKFESMMRKLGTWKTLTANEKKFRFETFKKNLKVIDKFVPPPLGKDGKPLLGSVAASFRKGINKFAFLTDEEFRQRYLIQKSVLYAQTSAQSLRDNSSNLFDSFLGSNSSSGSSGGGNGSADQVFLDRLDAEMDDFEDKTFDLSAKFQDLNSFLESSESALVDHKVIASRGRFLQAKQLKGRALQSTVLPGVKNQMDWTHLFNRVYDQLNCNSCYAAASLGAIEAVYKKKHPTKSSIFLSVQEIMDCSTENSHCLGGQPSSVMKYVKDYGVAYAKEYPYQQKKVHCRARYYLNQMRLKTGPRILESLLSNTNGRILQYSRFSSDPRFNSNRNRTNQFNRSQNSFNSVYNSNRNNQFSNFSNQQRFGNNSNNNTSRFNQFGRQNQWNPTRVNQNQWNQNPASNYSGARNNGFNNQYRGNQFNNNNHFHTHSTPNNFNNRIQLHHANSNPSSQLKLDGPNRTYYHELVSYPNGVRKVEYRDMLGRPYVPSFVQQPQGPPVVTPDNSKADNSSDDELSELSELKDTESDMFTMDPNNRGKDEDGDTETEKSSSSSAADNSNVQEEQRKQEEAKRKAEEEAKRKAEEDARKKAEEEAKKKAEENARIKAQEEARKKAEEAARLKAEEEARRKQQENASGPRFEQLKGFFFLKKNVIDVIKALQYGPVVTAHFVSESFKFYESGVFDGDGCEDSRLEYVNHASVIVGYDLTAPIPFFKLRNSWADDWGEQGYYRMKIGDLDKSNPGICLIAGTPFMVFPYLEK